MIACRCDVYAADHSLELNERMSLIVEVRRASLATGTEIGVVAHGTLVAVADYVRRLVAAERPVAIDAMVTSLAERCSGDFADWFINRDKTMSRMDETGIDDAC
jgi:hypothetical protein